MFRYFELRDGTLEFEIVPGTHMRDGVGIDASRSINYQKFSIHPTLNSPHYCLIKFTQNGRNTEQKVYTKSERLKGGEATHILSKRMSSLEGLQHKIKVNRSHIEIARFDPSQCCLTTHIYVRPVESSAVQQSSSAFSAHTISAGKFAVDILMNFIPFPALPSGYLFRVTGPVDDALSVLGPRPDGQALNVMTEDTVFEGMQDASIVDGVLRADFFEDISIRSSNPQRAFALLSEIYQITGPRHGCFFETRFWQASHLWQELSVLMGG